MNTSFCKIIKAVLFILVFLCPTTIVAQRWQLTSDEQIRWRVGSNLPHNDDIEMSGLQLSAVIRYAVTADSALTIDRSIIWPMLRIEPNITRSHLNRHFDFSLCQQLKVNGRNITKEVVDSVSIGEILTFDSHLPLEKISITRQLYPSPTHPIFIEKITFKNIDEKTVEIEIPHIDINYRTNPDTGIYGEYIYGATNNNSSFKALAPNEEYTTYIEYYGRRVNCEKPTINPEEELSHRQEYAQKIRQSLILETPDSVINRMFAFAKIRASESIYKTKGGLMHGPGGESYYAAIWANDQAEYINPFFPFLGYDVGNESALNSFRLFARYMNDAYEPIPSSIISEGVGFWHRVRDRGDCAMIAYGATRYALALGDKEIANELWSLIEWCLEYCRRQIDENGVVRSDTDELENRFPTGEANLCTSSLYYDALKSASYLAKELGKSREIYEGYYQSAIQMEEAIEKHFGAVVEGYDTYRYYEGNDILRSWICIPLTMGIYNRAKETIRALFSPRLWTDDGLLTQAGTTTYWDRSTLYALRGVFAAGETQEGIKFLRHYSYRRLLGERVPYAIEAWPEGSQRHLSAESGLYCRIFTEGIFGIRPTGFKSFELCPNIPDEWNEIHLHAIKAFGDNFDIDIVRHGKIYKVTITTASGRKIKRNIKAGMSKNIKLP